MLAVRRPHSASSNLLRGRGMTGRIDDTARRTGRLSSTSLRSNARRCGIHAAELSLDLSRGISTYPLRRSLLMPPSRYRLASLAYRARNFASSSSTSAASSSPTPLLGPRPPMPRVHPSVLMNSMEQMNAEASLSHARSLTSRLRNWYNEPGSLLLLVGWSALGLVVVDRYLQYMDHQDAVRLVASVSMQQQRKRDEMHQQFASAPALYNVEVVTAYHEMGGTHGLKARLKPGDTLEVLQENVGPSGLYLMVRTSRPVAASREDSDDEASEPPQIGWYPRAFVKPVEEKPSAGTSGRGILHRIWEGRT